MKRKMMMKIGYRTIKTAIGTPIAIALSQVIGLSNVVSAGIITMLCIQPSRKQSFKSAWDRFLACLFGIIIAVILFEIIAYHPITIGIILLIFIPICVYFKITEGIVTSSVIMLNLFRSGDITLPLIGEQFILIFIGIGVALIMNVYMPSLESKLIEKRDMLEKKFQTILAEIACFVKEKNLNWDGKELIEAEKILEDAYRLVATDLENQILKNETTYADYFSMRRKQLRCLQRMLSLVSRIHQVEGISEKIAHFFEQLSESVNPNTPAIVFLDQLSTLRHTFADSKLPKTRAEFETRANLYRLLSEIEEYLHLKHEYNKRHTPFLHKKKTE